jgi:hypothetical protein
VLSRTPSRERARPGFPWRRVAGVAALGGLGLLALPRGVRECDPSDLDVVPRARWQAAAPRLDAPREPGLFHPTRNPDGWQVYSAPLAGVLRTLVVHHSAMPPQAGPRQIQLHHVQERGFADIGYHFVIDPAGLVYEGRPLTVRGAHTAGHNTGTIGIALAGSFEVSDPTRRQLDALERLGACLSERYGVTHLTGHAAFQPDGTACPGRRLAARLPALARALGLRLGTDGYRPPDPTHDSGELLSMAAP